MLCNLRCTIFFLFWVSFSKFVFGENHKSCLSNVQVYFNFDKQVDEDQEFARRFLKSLALLCNKVLPGKANEDIDGLLAIVENALSECVPSHETAEILISTVSQTLLEYKARKKQKAKSDIGMCMQSSYILISDKVTKNLKKPNKVAKT